MNRTWFLGIGLVGCADAASVAIPMDPPARLAGVHSELVVPDRCPIWAPGDSDAAGSPPFPDDIYVACAVDSAGATYGIARGDQGPTDMVVLPGDRELGVMIAFRPDLPPDLTHLDLAGPNPVFRAFAAPVNVYSYDECCAEDLPTARIPLEVVAAGPSGILLSAGHFDTQRVQLEIDEDNARLFPGFTPDVLWNMRVYVNDAPDLHVWE